MTRAVIAGALVGWFVAFPAFGVSAGDALADAMGTSIPHHDVRIRVDPDNREIIVDDRITAEGIDVLRLAPWLNVSRIEIDGTPAPLAVHDGVVRLPSGAAGSRTIAVRYAGSPLPATEKNDRPGAAPSAAIGPEGTFLPGGTSWLPRLDPGPLPMTYRLHVSLPGDQVAIATGRLVEERAKAERYEAVFVSERPGEEPSLFAGPYAIRERVHGQVRLRTYFHPQAVELADAYLSAAATYLDAFSVRIGPYPFSSFSIVSSPFPVGLGFPGIAYVSRQILPLPFMQGRSLAHEILHNWWGSGVNVDYASGNWAEGLTTYMADYALATADGDDAARTMRYEWLRDFAALPTNEQRPVVDFVGKEHVASQAVGYGKAAFIFHMLEQEIGADVFAASLRQFWRDNKFRSAAWRDLQEAFEAASGRDLGWFFTQWLEKPGAPRVYLDGATAMAVNDDSGSDVDAHRLAITLRQNEDVYRFAMPVLVTTTASTTSTERILLDAREATVQLDVPDPPVRVIADPDYEVFRRLHPEEAPPILRDVTLDPSTILVVAGESPEFTQAAQQLAERLLARKPPPATATTGSETTAPLLLIGTDAHVENALQRLGLDAPPPAIAVRGSARAWTGQRQAGARYAVVSAVDGDALAAVQRPLSHHGRASYIAFEDSKAIVIGTWPVDHGPLRVELTP